MKTVQINENQHKQIVISEPGNYTIKLKGPSAHADILGAFHLTGDDKLNVNVNIIHDAQNTSADTLLRAVVSGKASANINGKIVVKKGAQQTNSFLAENVLLASKQAKATAVPDLEIEADEVKCSHAATVGKINENQLFYLMSRGLSKTKAKKLITDGFLKPVFNRISDKQ